MKLFLATNEETLRTQYSKMLDVSILSALKNTNFEIYLIFDGDKNKVTLPDGINIIEHKHRCFNTFKNSKKCSDNDLQLRAASSAYLRTEIPFLLKKYNFDDDFCLYTDYDVIFQKNDFSELESIKPNVFAVSTETNKEDWINFNTGVMVMNINFLYKNDSLILNYINENFENLNVWDQTLYQNLYSNMITKLDILYNWKPYWGINSKAKIIHFHGPKPYSVDPKEDTMKVKVLENLHNMNPDSYDYYNQQFNSYL